MTMRRHHHHRMQQDRTNSNTNNTTPIVASFPIKKWAKDTGILIILSHNWYI